MMSFWVVSLTLQFWLMVPCLRLRSVMLVSTTYVFALPCGADDMC